MKDKTAQIKNLQKSIFEDIKAYNHFKYKISLFNFLNCRNSLQHTAKMVPNLKYPYFFQNGNPSTNDSERPNGV